MRGPRRTDCQFMSFHQAMKVCIEQGKQRNSGLRHVAGNSSLSKTAPALMRSDIPEAKT